MRTLPSINIAAKFSLLKFSLHMFFVTLFFCEKEMASCEGKLFAKRHLI